MTEKAPDVEIALPVGLERVKQRDRRASVRIPVRISTIDPEQDAETGKLCFFSAEEFSANVSRGGAFIFTPARIDPGHRVLVEIDIPNGSSIQAVGRVVWQRLASGQTDERRKQRPGIGVEFVSGHPDRLNELDRYINLAVQRRGKVAAFDSTSPSST